jgi:hypothetical protein
LSDFLTQFQQIDEFIRSSAKSVMSKIDHFTFKMLVDNLKSPDAESVADTIEQLVKEQKPAAIPPLYFVYRMHANRWVRGKAEEGLKQLDPKGEIEKLTHKDGKELDVKDAVGALIEKYGHYRS